MRTKRTNDFLKEIFKQFQPPKDLTVSEWAAENRVLVRQSSAEPGKWKNERTPYLVEIMNALSDPAVSDITVAACAQVGKTEAELNFLGYIIDQDPGSVLYVLPNVDEAKKFSRLRIAPAIRASKTLKDKVSDAKSRDSGNTLLQKEFSGGMLTLVGTNSPAGLAGNPIRYVIGDELDRWAISSGTEGNPWKLASERTQSFYNRKLIAVSTPTIKGASQIEKLYDRGTQEHWCLKCPNCSEYHEITFNSLSFESVITEQGNSKIYDAKNIYWICPGCGVIAYENEMRKQPGKWVAQAPENLKYGHRSFWMKGFTSPWKSWKSRIVSFLEAEGDPAELQVVFNTEFGELWEERASKQTEDGLMKRREAYGVREDGKPVDLPEGVLVLTCGVDTQDDRLEYEIVGHGFHGETWGIKRGKLFGDPAFPEVWYRLDDVLDRIYLYKDPDLHGLKIALTFVDAGGHKTQSVYRECKKRKHKPVCPIKGAHREGIPFTKPPSRVKIIQEDRVIGTTWYYEIGVNAGKAAIMSAVEVEEPGPRYCHFPLEEEKGYNAEYFKSLLSETKVQEIVNGRKTWKWKVITGHERNEMLDCRNYALAAFEVLNEDLEMLHRRLHRIKDERAELLYQQKKEKKKKRKSVQRGGGTEW